MKQVWERIAMAGGHHLDEVGFELLTRYRDWLREEAISAGGLGPDEAKRVEKRHITDSLLFSLPLEAPASIWDLGSGVGLPGIPLAILFAKTPVVLVDRSGRRVDLAKRAVRLLGLDNVEVKQERIEDLGGQTDVVVARAGPPPEKMTMMAKRLLTPDGVVVVGGSWVKEPTVPGWSTMEVGREWLDRPVWLLIMRSQ